MQGIYQIKNLVNGKVYIGSAVNFKKRWDHHKFRLKKGNHHSSHLQRSWEKYGGNVFIFEIIETVEDKENLLQREQYYLDKYESYNHTKGYNICPKAGTTLGVVCSDETKRKISEVKKGKLKGEDNPFYGKKHTTEVKEKMSELKKNIVGEKHSKSKTTNEQAKQVKILLRDTSLLMREIAEIVGVSFNVVSNIKRGHSWTHIQI